MWRVNVALRQFPLKGFQLSPRTSITDLKLLNSHRRLLNSSRKVTSTISKVKSAFDSRTNETANAKLIKPQNDDVDLVAVLKNHQEALTLLTTDFHPIKSVLVKPEKRSKSQVKTGPAIDRDGYAVSSALRAFVEACDVISEVPLALKSFRNIQSTMKKINKSLPLDISLYHILLRSVSRRGLIQDYEHLWESMVADRHVPDSAAFASFVQCLGSGHLKSNSEDLLLSNKFVVDRIQEMKTREISLQDVYNAEGIFPLQKDLDNFLDGSRLIDSNFELTVQFRNIDYDESCSLVAPLNQRRTDRLSSSVAGAMTRSDMSDCFKVQLRREETGFVDIKSIVNQGGPDAEQYTDKLCTEWKASLRRALELQINRLTKRSKFTHNPRNIPIYPFFKVLDVDDYVDIMIQEVTKVLVFSDSYSPTVAILQVELGNEVMKKFRRKKKMTDGFEEKMENVFNDYFDWYFDPGKNPGTWCHREAMRKTLALRRGSGPNLYEGLAVDWPFAIRVAVGRELFHIILNELRVNLSADGSLIVGGEVVNLGPESITTSPAPANRSSCPAMYKLFRLRKDQRNTEEVKPHPVLVKLFGPQKLRKIRFLTTELPMLVPSVPWTCPSHGGFLLENTSFVRAAEDSSLSPLEVNALDNRLMSAYPVFDSLNQLGSTPWKINVPVLDLVMHVFCNQTNEQFSKNLLANLSIPMSEEKLMQEDGQEFLNFNEQVEKGVSDEAANKNRVAQKQAFYQMQKECFSLWCNTLYGLSIANFFRQNIVFFPHNIDFRGRVYPLPPHFNHMGNDLSRSLLVFAKGKPLGPGGLDWLKIHCVNLTGKKKKESMEARLQFANENMDQILSSANHPFENVESSWWLDSDEPWQTLAACLEIRNAMQSPCPENFISHLPIHQDGSCNGLQHYAALGRDVLGGRSVNVLPSPRPQDVYSEIAAIVNQKRHEDEINGHPIATILNGFVDRKVIKQTVMTTVYGVTPYGAKLQIARQLKDKQQFPLEDVDKASKYLATKTFESLNEMFTASQQIQAWFTDCANVISGTFLKNVEWETPLGLEVIQPYTKRTGNHPKTSKPELSSVPVLPYESGMTNVIHLKPNTLKQRNGFPPNFVHSLDSTHMMLTSLYLWDAGVTFASVHDCYWTHACSVTQMNVTCREQFVALHSQPILENLSKSFFRKIRHHDDDVTFPGGKKTVSRADIAKAKILFAAIPKKGQLDLELVKDSVYFFS